MNKLFIVIAALLSAMIIFFSYKWLSREKTSELVTIYPDYSVTKIKPNDANNNVSLGAENTIYDNFKAKKFSARKVNLLPEPEQPINIVVSNKDDFKKNAIDPIDLILADIAKNEQNKSDLPIEDIIFPELLDGNNFNQESLDHTTAELIKENDQKKEEIEVVNIAKDETYKNIKITKVTENNKLNNYATKQNNNGFKIQLASVKSENLGQLEGQRIQKKFPKILGQLNITIQKIEPEKNKFFYLIFAGTFPNISKAKAACKKLSSKGQTCIVTR